MFQERSLNIPAEGSLNIPFERSWNVHTKIPISNSYKRDKIGSYIGYDMGHGNLGRP